MVDALSSTAPVYTKTTNMLGSNMQTERHGNHNIVMHGLYNILPNVMHEAQGGGGGTDREHRCNSFRVASAGHCEQHNKELSCWHHPILTKAPDFESLLQGPLVNAHTATCCSAHPQPLTGTMQCSCR